MERMLAWPRFREKYSRFNVLDTLRALRLMNSTIISQNGSKNTKHGLMNCSEVEIKSAENGCFKRTEPENNSRGLGYAECPACNRDFHCVATIDDGNLNLIEPDLENPPLIPDRENDSSMRCSLCGFKNARLQFFDGFFVGRFICDTSSCSEILLFRYDENDNVVEFPYTMKSKSLQNR